MMLQRMYTFHEKPVIFSCSWWEADRDDVLPATESDKVEFKVRSFGKFSDLTDRGEIISRTAPDFCEMCCAESV